MELQVEGIYTAEPRFEAKAKALKIKQEMAAAAEEGRKRLRGMPGLDLVETPKPLERQIRTEVEARVPEEVWKPKTTRMFEKPEIYDRTVTPSSIAGLGEAASVARLRGAMANLAYNQNKLRQLADEPLTTTGGAALSPTLGNLDRWLDQPRQRERYETQRLVQRRMQKLPTLDYLSWAERGMPRPETYTKENLTDYVPRIEQLANYPWEMTKEMRSEAKEVINTAHPVGTIGNGGSLVNFDPYRQALAAKDDEAAAKWADLFYKLDGNVHTKQYAVGKGFMDGTGYTSAMDVITQLSPLEQSKQEFKAFQNGADLAAKKEPSLYSTTNLMGTAAQLWLMSRIGGAGLGALGLSGPLARVLQGMLSVGGSEAIQNLGDFVAGKMTPEQYWTSVEHGVRTGGALAGLIELIPAAKRDFMDRFSQRKAGKGGSTALVPASSASEPVGMEEELAEKEFDAYFERGYNETEDYEEWERLTGTLGEDAPESFQEFQEIKYAVPEEYADLEGFYQYKIENPSSGREFYEAEKVREMLLDAGEIKATGVVVAVPEQETIILNQSVHAQERLFERGLTVEEVQSFIDHAEFALKQQKGMVYAFYSQKGFAAIDINGNLRTAGYLDENGMKLYYQVVKIIEGYK